MQPKSYNCPPPPSPLRALQVAQALQLGLPVQPESYECVGLFFSDIVGYTDLCSQLLPEEVMDLLNRLYTRFDAITRELELFKVETIGEQGDGKEWNGNEDLGYTDVCSQLPPNCSSLPILGSLYL